MEAIADIAEDDQALLLAGLRQGRAEAYEALMRRYNRLLFRAARGIAPDDAQAQDAVQEAYLCAFLALGSFRGEASLATWLSRIVINQALSQQRKLGRLVSWTDDSALEDADMAAHDPHDAATAHAASPEDDLARHQLRRRIEVAIDLLPAIYRIVFILRAVQGLDVRETASALQVSADVVKTRYLRARALLRAQLGEKPEQVAAIAHDFRGERCDRLVASVLAQLRMQGVLRDQ